MLKHNLFRMRDPLLNFLKSFGKFLLLLLDFKYGIDLFDNLLLVLMTDEIDIILVEQLKQIIERLFDLLPLDVQVKYFFEPIKWRVMFDLGSDLIDKHGYGIYFSQI